MNTLKPEFEGLDVEQMLADALSEEIEKELVAAGHGTKAERDQKIINEILRIHNESKS